jgi:hypothetical protein
VCRLRERGSAARVVRIPTALQAQALTPRRRSCKEGRSPRQGSRAAAGQSRGVLRQDPSGEGGVKTNPVNGKRGTGATNASLTARSGALRAGARVRAREWARQGFAFRRARHLGGRRGNLRAVARTSEISLGMIFRARPLRTVPRDSPPSLPPSRAEPATARRSDDGLRIVGADDELL